MGKLAHDHVKKVTAAPYTIFFQIIDSNNDNYIQVNEFEKFFDTMGLDSKMADAAFKAIDTNNDGLLSLEEFTDAGIDFFTSQHETANQGFFGPLEE